MATLSGTYLDLITDGVPHPVTRDTVVRAVRTVMLSAHRSAIPFDRMHGLLTDERTRKLAVQIITGRGGRRMTVRQRDKFLRDVWDQTGKVAAERPAWSRDDALAAIEFVRDNWGATESLPERHQAVLTVVLDLATEYGTTRPVVPVRVVAERTGIPFQTVSRILVKIAGEGRWLKLVKRGNHHTGRASLYTLAPELLHEFTWNVWGASPPVSHPVPMSHPPMSHFEEESMSVSLALTASTPEALREALLLLVATDPAQAEQVLAEVRHLHAVPMEEAQ